MTADEIIELLGLQPQSAEGGWFHETYRADERLVREALHVRYDGPRALSTCIYYLLTPGTCSRMHRLGSDEIFHFYGGDAVEMLLLRPGGAHRVIHIGADLAAGQRPQRLVPAGMWQGARIAAPASAGYALLGTTVAPGFEYADFEVGTRADLVTGWPEAEDMIAALTG